MLVTLNANRQYQQQNKKMSNGTSTLTSLKKQSQKDSVSFGSGYDDEIERRTQAQRKDYDGWDWFWGGEDKAREKAKAEYDQEILDLRVGKAVSRAERESHERHLAEMRRLMDDTQKAKDGEIAAYKEAVKAGEATIIEKQNVVDATNRLAEDRAERVKEMERLLAEQKETAERHDAENKELIRKMEEAARRNDEKAQEALRQQQELLKEIHEKQLEAILAKMNNVSNTEAIFQKMEDTKNAKGFAKIAGYNAEKEVLKNHVGSAIALERSGKPADVPNGILFFGPKGCGKTTFTDAFAHQLNCRIVKIEDLLDPAENMKQLKAVAIEAQKHFATEGQRTILQIDEFDDFAPKGSRIIGPLKAFMDNVSREHHCTVFATTNYPEKIDDILLRDGRFDLKVGLSPANKPNALAVLKHYGEKFADGSVNFDELSEHLTASLPNEAYSNGRIESVVSKFVKTNTAKLKMSHEDFVRSIKEVGPDISKEALELFKKQIEYVKKA